MYVYFCVYSISELFCAYLQNLVYNHFELKHDYFFDIAEDIYIAIGWQVSLSLHLCLINVFLCIQIFGSIL